jgi:hypothetical protein
LAATEPDATTEGTTEGQRPPSGAESLSADLVGRGPRVSTRTLVVTVLVLAVLLVVSAVVAFVVLHQPRLTPVPVPSVSSIA